MTDNKNVRLDDIVTLKTFCESHDIDAKRARRMARHGQFDGAFQFAGKWVIDKNAPIPVMTDARTRRTRSDGRQRYTVYMTVDERATVAAIVGNDNVVDVRALAKQRRDARKQNDNGGNENE